MKNTIKLFGIIALAALIGFAITACPEPEDKDKDPDPKLIEDITWELGQVGGVPGADGAAPTATTTAITITFSEAVELTEADIHISGAASHDNTQELSSSGNVWTVPVTVTHTDLAKVTVNKDGVEGGEKSVLVYKQGEAQAITWTAVADGTEGTANSTKITITFSEDVDDLDEDDITLTDDNGSATKGILTGSGTTWELAITVTTPGFVTVAITKTGISATPQDVEVHKEGVEAQDITWTAVADGTANTTSSTIITFTFSAAVHDLVETDITIHNGTGAVTKGELTGSETTWELGITVETEGTVSVSVTKAGVSAAAQDVTVHKAASIVVLDITWSAVADGESGTTTSTKITFTFSDAVSDLEASNIIINSGTGTASNSGTLTGEGTSWELSINVETQGQVSVSVTKTGISAEAQLVDVYKESNNPITDGLTTYINTMDQLVFTISGSTYALNRPQSSEVNGGKYSWRSQATGTWTWDEGAQTITLTVNTARVTGQSQLVNKTTAETSLATYITDMITESYNTTYEEELAMWLEWETDEEEAEMYAMEAALAAANVWYDTDGETLEEIIALSIAKELEEFDTRSYTYTHSTDGESLILLEPLPPSDGQDVLSGQVYYGYQWGMVDETHSYSFTNGTYVETISPPSWNPDGVSSTKSGAYSYNATTKRVYLKPATIDGVTPLQFYEDIDMEDVSNPYPTDADYRTATTHSLFRTTNNSYDTVTDPYTEVEAQVIKPRG
jgi:methionine-rich copper-binding protein CopC